MKPIEAGKLRHRGTIQQKTETPDSYGELIETWTTLATVWCSVEPISGREFFAAQQVQAEVSARIRIRYRPGITPLMRIKVHNTTYEIVSVIDFEYRHRELQLMCKVVE